MKYVYNSKKKKRYYHIGDLKETLCKLHHSRAFVNIDTETDKPPKDRKLCSICRQQSKKKKKLKKVLKERTGQNSQVDASSYKFLQTYEWKKLRMEVLSKYPAVCMGCGADKERDHVRLQVDHIKSRKRHPELALDINNLQILCADCNHGKGNWCEKDFR